VGFALKQSLLATAGARTSLFIGFAAYLALIAYLAASAPHWAPDGVQLHLLGMSLEARAGAARLVAVGLVPLGVLPAVFLLELAFVGWAGSSLRQVLVRPSRSVMTDMAVYALQVIKVLKVLGAIMTLGAILISTGWLRGQLAEATGLSLTVAGLPLLAQVAVLYLVFSFFDYWSHRAEHSRPFWPLHRYHHAADAFCILSASRSHPAALAGVIIALSAVVVGGSATAILMLAVGVAALRFLQHSRLDSDFGWVGRYLLMSPRHHRLHHALGTRPEEAGNFGLCPIWERMFGTWRQPPEGQWAIGVATPYRHGALVHADIWRDYKEFWLRLLAPLAKPRPRLRAPGEA